MGRIGVLSGKSLNQANHGFDYDFAIVLSEVLSGAWLHWGGDIIAAL